MQLKISVDVKEVQDELHRLMGAPDLKTVLAFNEIFASVTAEVAALIHVETGSLKTTPKWDSPAYPGGWQGTVRVGGAAPGAVNDPAYYGVYELARGGTHFFFAPAYADIPTNMVNAIISFYSNSNMEMIRAASPSLSGSDKVAIKSAAKGATHKAKSKTESLKSRAKKAVVKKNNGFYIGGS